MWNAISTWVAEALAVFLKDWRCEFRTRTALNTLALFALTSLVIVSLSLGPLGTASSERETVLPVILWILLLFAASAGLPRSFVHEEEVHTAIALRLAAPAGPLFAGKLLYSLTLLWALELLITPVYLAMVQLPVGSPGLLVVALALGGYGLAAGSTLVAAITSQARGTGALFSVLAFPILAPLLLLAIDLTRTAVLGDGPDFALRQLILYDAAVTVAGMMLFPTVWNP